MITQRLLDQKLQYMLLLRSLSFEAVFSVFFREAIFVYEKLLDEALLIQNNANPLNQFKYKRL